jgi:hypothetical protein
MKGFFGGAGLRLGGACLLAAGGFVVLLCVLFEPLWETNDDVAMSMVAHGYGLAAQSSPNLFFSNVLWGYVVRMIPSMGGIPGYSLATLGVLVVVGAVVLYGLIKSGVGYFSAVVMMILLLIRPILFPQFTINAGLLMVAAVICWHVAASTNDKLLLAMGCVLSFFSYLVRTEEFLLIVLIALPLLPWRFLSIHQTWRFALAMLMLAVGLASFLNHHAYQGADWKAFDALNAARAPITDYGADVRLEHRPDILQKYGYSLNDISLVRKWFFVDPHVVDVKALQAMVNELGAQSSNESSLTGAWRGVRALWSPDLVVSLLAALALLICRPHWRVFASWLLCLAAFSIIGFMGRPGMLRIYVPVLGLLLIAPFLMGKVAGWGRRLAVGVIIFATASDVYAASHESWARQADAEQVRQALSNFPSYPVVIWGSAFPFEKIYPVLGARPEAMSYRLYALGVFTLAPFSVSAAEHEAHRDMLERLKAPDGLPVVASQAQIQALGVYCHEHMHGHLVVLGSEFYGQINMQYLKCDTAAL